MVCDCLCMRGSEGRKEQAPTRSCFGFVCIVFLYHPVSLYFSIYCLQIKTGDVRVLANTSLHLARKDWSSEIRLHGFKMLQVRECTIVLFFLFA